MDFRPIKILFCFVLFDITELLLKVALNTIIPTPLEWHEQQGRVRVGTKKLWWIGLGETLDFLLPHYNLCLEV